MKRPIARSVVSGLLALTSCFIYAACGSSASSLCQDLCDCTGCSNADLEECIDNIEDVEKQAEDAGCDDDFDDALSCAADELRCTGSTIDLDGCDAENERLANCLGPGASFGGGGFDVCSRAAAICAEEAGTTPDPSQQIECTGATECASQCIVDTDSCSSDAVLECVSGC